VLGLVELLILLISAAAFGLCCSAAAESEEPGRITLEFSASVGSLLVIVDVSLGLK
jgi:hypothetical protein